MNQDIRGASSLAYCACRRCQRESSFSQGGRWNALINRYMGVIPLSGDALSAAEHIASAAPDILVTSAMPAKVGAAARLSQPAAPGAAAALRRLVSS